MSHYSNNSVLRHVSIEADVRSATVLIMFRVVSDGWKRFWWGSGTKQIYIFILVWFVSYSREERVFLRYFQEKMLRALRYARGSSKTIYGRTHGEFG